jgi:ribosomal protein S27AE
MDRPLFPPAVEGLRARTERLVRQGSDLPAFQTRTCAHCGQLTTFALHDRAGSYACLACGRYA